MATSSSATKSRTKSTFRTSKTLITPKSAGSNSTTISSKSVYLEDWWLVKAQGKGLAVGGFSSTETQVRLFCSGAIATRHDYNTLGTSDGFTISFTDVINRSRTLGNDFPSEVCNRFLIGFPYDWEEYAARCCGEKSSKGCVPNRGSAFDEFSMSFGDRANSFLPGSLDDFPVTRTPDLLVSTLDDSGNCALMKSIYDDILEKLGGEPFRNTGNSVHSKTEGNDLKVDSAQGDTPHNHKKAKVNKKSKDRNVLLNAKYIKTETHKNSYYPNEMGMDVLTLNSGVATRSMTRRMSSQNNEEDPSLNTSPWKGISDLSGNKHQGRVTRSSSIMSRSATLFKEKEKDAKKMLDKSAFIRSSIKRKNLANYDL